jgi:hypothetical protein
MNKRALIKTDATLSTFYYTLSALKHYRYCIAFTLYSNLVPVGHFN